MGFEGLLAVQFAAGFLGLAEKMALLAKEGQSLLHRARVPLPVFLRRVLVQGPSSNSNTNRPECLPAFGGVEIG